MVGNRKVLLLELNEFNVDLLIRAAKKLSLKNLERVIAFHRVNMVTEDTYESDFLDPWVEWVSVHTGKPSSEHKIKHLGDVPHLGMNQIWEELSLKGITSGIWGALNASKGKAANCLFFLPDPWTISENAYPEELNTLLDPVRYLSKNYSNISKRVFLGKIGKLLKFVYKKGLLRQFMAELPRLTKNMFRYRAKNFVFISFFDYLSTLLFLKYKKEYNPDFSLIFLNSLAHLEHHHWKEMDPIKNAPLVYGLGYIDRALGEIFQVLDEKEIILVTNALSQKNTSEECAWILYRQKDQEQFLQTIGIAHKRVESLMTHDAHIYFEDEKQALLAKEKLSAIEILGQKLFLVEEYPQDRTKLFYRIRFTDEVPQETQFSVSGKPFRFFDLFQPIVRRTGKHIPEGTCFCNQWKEENQIKNHDLFNCILKWYA